jgi:hypothetical protein
LAHGERAGAGGAAALAKATKGKRDKKAAQTQTWRTSISSGPMSSISGVRFAGRRYVC